MSADLIPLASYLLSAWVSGFAFGYLLYALKRMMDFM